MKLISIITPCFNEENNVQAVYARTKEVFSAWPMYAYEHIFIDNASTDSTVNVLKGIARQDNRVKIIVNARNFGHIRSPFYALMQAGGDAAVIMAADLQDPPALIHDFLRQWESGYKVVVGVKKRSQEPVLMRVVRRSYYAMIHKLADVELVRDFMGFGLYDKAVLDAFRSIDDPYPYLRGLVCEVGFERAYVEYVQPARQKGKTKNNFYTLYDIAMLGFVNHSKLPLRLASFLGFGVSFLSILCAVGYLIYKLVFWDTFQVGMAPMVIGIFFIGGIQLFFLGVIGEYVGSIHTQVQHRPLVVEKERVNF